MHHSHHAPRRTKVSSKMNTASGTAMIQTHRITSAVLDRMHETITAAKHVTVNAPKVNMPAFAVKLPFRNKAHSPQAAKMKHKRTNQIMAGTLCFTFD